MTDSPSSLLGTLGVVVVPNGLDVVTVEIVDERRVVPRPVVAPVAGPAVVAPAGGERRAVEPFDLVLVPRFERDVRRLDPLAFADPKVRVLAVVETRGLAKLHLRFVAERRQGAHVKLLRGREIADRQSRMRDHRSSFPPSKGVRVANR